MITAEQYAQSLFDAISEVRPEDQDKVLDNFVNILSQNGDLRLYPKIEESYKRLELQSKGIKEVEVTTAGKSHANKEILSYLNKLTAGKAEVKEKIDAGLIGGVVIRADDTLIDASIKTTLNSLKKEMEN